MMGHGQTLESLAHGLLAGRRLEHPLWLRFGDCRLRLDSDSPDLVASLRSYFSDFCVPEGPVDISVQALEGPALELDLPLVAKEPDPGKPRVKEEFIDLDDGRLVRKRLTGMVFMLGASRHLAVGPCLANDNQVVNFLNSRYIQWLLDRGYLLCHAAAVATSQRGLVLAGFSGMGKSTLALHLMSQGVNFVSNDRLLLRQQDDGLAMHGVAKLPRINPGTALTNTHLVSVLSTEDKERFQALSTPELWTLEHKYNVYLDRCFGPGRFQLAAKTHGLVILNWREKGGGCRLREVDLAQRPDPWAR